MIGPQGKNAAKPLPLLENEDQKLLEGLCLALWRGGDFFAFHEEVEDLWRPRTGSAREFLQGLILAAVSMHHWRMGNIRSAKNVARKSLLKLAPHPEFSMNLDLRDLRKFLDGFCARIEANPAHGPAFDALTIPEIRTVEKQGPCPS